MKINRHERSPKPETMELTANPLSLWLTRHVEIVVRKGDSLGKVARAIRETWTHLSIRESRELTAMYFAVGERRAGLRRTDAGWTILELNASKERRYLVRNIVTTE